MIRQIATIKRTILLSAALVAGGCAVDQQTLLADSETSLLTLDEQLDNAYVNCRKDGIVDLKTLQDKLNDGGGGLSKLCVEALGKIDFEELIASSDFKLDFDTPLPDVVINPLKDDPKWRSMSRFDTATSSHYFTSGGDTNIANNIKVTGIAPDGSDVPLHNFILQNIDVDEVAVNFITDYSTSMVNSDLLNMSNYFKTIYDAFPKGVATQVAIFSDAIKYRTSGFSTDYNTVQKALDFDHTYIRGATALYDSWAQSIAGLVYEDKRVLVNILMTDGFENASSPRSRKALERMIEETGVFNVVIASTWAEPGDLQDLIGENGFVAFKYQIENSQTIIADIAQALRNMKVLRVEDDIGGLDGIRLEYLNEAKLLIPIKKTRYH